MDFSKLVTSPSVSIFGASGERLSIAMNWNVHDSDEQLLRLGKSEEQKKEFYEFQRAAARKRNRF